MIILPTHYSDSGTENTLQFDESSLSEVSKEISSSNKVEFESFAFVEEGQHRSPTNEELRMILKAFPSANSVGVFLPLVAVSFSKLPSKPWPLSVAGLPVVLTTHPHSIRYDRGRLEAPGQEF